MPTATEDDIGWAAVERLSVDAAALLRPAFEAHHGRNGRLSIQTDPRLYRDAAAIVDRRERFDRLAPNMIVKIPATRAGIDAIEAATARGHQHQRHRVLHAAAVRRRGRGGRARARAARGGRPRHLDAWARCARSWSAGSTTG